MEEKQDFKIYSEKIRAGRRVYFFDIKPTKSDDYYLVLTEKKKLNGPDNLHEKHRIFLYKEDLNKFMKAIQKATSYMKTDLMPNFDFDKYDRESINLLEESEPCLNQY